MLRKSPPKVSVLMPVHNGEQSLKLSINSILEQSFSNLELIMLDDGSTDHTIDILREFATGDDRIVLLKNEKRYGIARSLNRCAAEAQGIFFARMDSDDKAHTNRLARQLFEFEKYPDLVVCGSNVIYADSKMRPLYRSNFPISDQDIKRSSVFLNPFAHSAVMMRASAFRSAGGYSENFAEDFDVAQDYDLWRRLIWRGRVGNINDSLMTLRRHRHSVSLIRRSTQNAAASQIQAEYANQLLGSSRFAVSQFENIRAHQTWGIKKTDQIKETAAEAILDVSELIHLVDLEMGNPPSNQAWDSILGRCLLSLFRPPFQLKKLLAVSRVIKSYPISPFRGSLTLVRQFTVLNFMRIFWKFSS